VVTGSGAGGKSLPMRIVIPFASVLGMVLGLACGVDGNDDAAAADSTGEAPACEHGMPSPCACTDGRMGEQTCDHEGAGFGPCVCDDPATSTDGSMGIGDDTTAAADASDDGSTGGSGETEGGTTAASDGSSSSADTGPVGSAPQASILHPSDGEERVVDVAIPFIGGAMDAEDGALSGASMSWASDVDGPIGQGEMFDAPLSTLGQHVITLTATDADGNVGEATITLTIVAP
jgi:hypothetical protein